MEASEFSALAAALATVMPADRPVLERRLAGLRRRAAGGRPVDRGLADLQSQVQASCARRERRAARLPVPEYPDPLPVVAQRDAIRAAIAAHQVVVVCGATGSGKTTQLPKICLELGRGAAGMIGHTQPRRIAARSLAARIAQELKGEVGHMVGYKVRFHDRVSPDSCLKVMTDGILLAETQGDPDLLQYDTIIIDEAHERSLNIDFLLGYLHRLLPRRPDLKLIITSATIDPQRFARHFGGAPVIEVSGRTYPVEMRYRPLLGDDPDEADRDRGRALLDAVDELAREGPGDILVFLPGEREIRDAAEALRKHHPPHTEILPLYARLSAAQQTAVFRPHGGRRIVLATNVAETSLTVPGIRYVVDTGLARISRYSYRTKVQRLPIEAVSQASADQRAGRCGRVAPGICIRLYGEDDYAARPPFTEPEILRTNLAAVILQMLALGLGDIERFPFVEPPDARYVRDGFKLLHELGAVDARQRLTETGRQLARLPVDPRLGRMVLAGRDHGCLREVLVIAAALAIQDPRERPLDHQQAADEKHRLFRDEHSDFLSFLRLWEFYHGHAAQLSQNKLRKLCREHFLSYLRMLEWHDVHRQLQALVKDMGLRPNEAAADYASVHRALLTGLLGNLAFKSADHEYTGARNLKLQIFPGSGQARKAPKWIMAAELVETGRRYARTVARIDPAWVEDLAAHLVKRSHAEPHWEQRAAQVAAWETVTLYGLPLVARRRVNYGPIDPVLSRELFIRGALVAGEYRTRAPFFAHNRALIGEVEELEAKARRRDLLVDEELLYRFYDERIPAGIYSGAAFERWRTEAEADNPRLLFIARDYLMQHGAESITEAQFPDHLEVAGLRLPLSYHFAPGEPDDGVTLTIPLAALNQLTPARFEWQVPGLRRDKVTALIKSLPKHLRRHFVPAPDFADACLQALAPGDESLPDALAHHLGKVTGVAIPADAWRPELLPPHLIMRFAVVDGDGRVLGAGRDLAQLQAELGGRAGRSFRALPTGDFERDDVADGDFGALPEFVEVSRGGFTLRGYPALVVEGERIALRLVDAPQAAAAAHRAGLLALFRRRCAAAVRHLERHLPDLRTLCLHYAPVGTCEALRSDLVGAVLQQALLADGDDIRDTEVFAARSEAAEGRLMTLANALCGWVGAALAEYHGLARRLKGSVPPQWLAAAGEVREQLDALIYPGFVAATPWEWLPHLARFLRAIALRLERLAQHPARDRQLAAAVAPLWRQCRERRERQRREGGHDRNLETYRWLLEEYRVSLFAQELKTSRPVSPQRLEKLWREVAP